MPETQVKRVSGVTDGADRVAGALARAPLYGYSDRAMSSANSGGNSAQSTTL